MSDRSAIPVTFVIQRGCTVPPARVFAAFSDPETKARWQESSETEAVDDDAETYIEFDFRVGGHERFAFAMDGVTFSYDAEYFDIVPNERIVYCYTMHANGKPDSISVVTIELGAEGAGTALTYTEQGVFLDNIDDPADRERGTADLLDNLVRYLAAQ
jgi:uncharacterized protein YndB with AHSA1/START domain